jgi:7-cyano-7-deazaguanine synthase
MKRKAIILLSGGLDSTVILALALASQRQCYAISFDYQQRHHFELSCAQRITAHYDIPHCIIPIDPKAFGNSALLNSTEIPSHRTIADINQNGIPNTYVPARNTLFLAYALSQCEFHNAHEIHFGPNRADQHCYPDCRHAYIKAFQELILHATQQSIEKEAPTLVTPLLLLDKKEIIHLGMILKAPLELTSSCYCPAADGTPCQICDACILRAEGFRQNTV